MSTRTERKPRTIFEVEYNGRKNFVTPTVLEYGRSGPYLWELSTGTAILSDDPIFGVTVLKELEDGTIERTGPPLSSMFFSEDEARDHIESLR